MSSEQKTTSNETIPFQVNQKKLKELAERSEAVKIGGKVRIEIVHWKFLIDFDYRRAQLVARRKSFIDRQLPMIKSFKVH
jgi:hypothetical protein